MSENINLQEAIRNSIQTEKDAMDFYKIAAAQMDKPEAKKVFDILAREEREHAGEFYNIYKGDDIPSLEDFLNTPPSEDSAWIAKLHETIHSDLDEREAMKIALENELSLEQNLRDMASQIEDPEARKIYENNANSTHNHYEIIESEYARLMAMVHETDIDTFVRE